MLTTETFTHLSQAEKTNPDIHGRTQYILEQQRRDFGDFRFARDREMKYQKEQKKMNDERRAEQEKNAPKIIQTTRETYTIHQDGNFWGNDQGGILEFATKKDAQTGIDASTYMITPDGTRIDGKKNIEKYAKDNPVKVFTIIDKHGFPLHTYDNITNEFIRHQYTDEAKANKVIDEFAKAAHDKITGNEFITDRQQFQAYETAHPAENLMGYSEAINRWGTGGKPLDAYSEFRRAFSNAITPVTQFISEGLNYNRREDVRIRVEPSLISKVSHEYTAEDVLADALGGDHKKIAKANENVGAYILNNPGGVVGQVFVEYGIGRGLGVLSNIVKSTYRTLGPGMKATVLNPATGKEIELFSIHTLPGRKSGIIKVDGKHYLGLTDDAVKAIDGKKIFETSQPIFTNETPAIANIATRRKFLEKLVDDAVISPRAADTIGATKHLLDKVVKYMDDIKPQKKADLELEGIPQVLVNAGVGALRDMSKAKTIFGAGGSSSDHIIYGRGAVKVPGHDLDGVLAGNTPYEKFTNAVKNIGFVKRRLGSETGEGGTGIIPKGWTIIYPKLKTDPCINQYLGDSL